MTIGGASRPVPRYDDLPRLGETDVRHAWDVWGKGDRLGTLNNLTDDVCLRALAVPRLGRRLHLDLPLTVPDPPLYRRAPLRHSVFARDRNMVEDEIGRLDPQSSSQWDSLRHIRAREFGFYGGIGDGLSPDADRLGIHTMAEHGFVTRGVLVDLVAFWESQGRLVDPFSEHAVSADDVVRVAEWQGIALARGDLLLLRTGWLRHYLAVGSVPDDHLDMPTSVGLSGAESTARFLWDTGVAAVAADNPAVEALPGDPRVGSLHRRLIPGLGMPLGELWNLEQLAAVCAETRRYECCVVSVPLNVPGGVASPANAVAVV